LVVGVAALAAIIWVPGWGPQLAAPGMCYVLMWVGTVLPCPEIIRREDISYGMYIYGFPVQQCLALAGFAVVPIPVFAATAIILTILPATISWIVVERPAQRRARGMVAYPWLRRLPGLVKAPRTP
jgi:peptidoglycan/LPS O-acetylase OafA/YrhL